MRINPENHGLLIYIGCDDRWLPTCIVSENNGLLMFTGCKDRELSMTIYSEDCGLLTFITFKYRWFPVCMGFENRNLSIHTRSEDRELLLRFENRSLPKLICCKHRGFYRFACVLKIMNCRCAFHVKIVGHRCAPAWRS